MLAFIEEFGFQAGLFCVISQSIKVYIEPIKRFAEYILVLHLIIYLTVIVVSQVNHHTSVLLFIEILQIA